MATPSPSLEAAIASRLVDRGFVVEDIDAHGIAASAPGSGDTMQLRLANLRRLLAQVEAARHDAVIDDWVAAAAAGLRGTISLEPPEADRLLPRLGSPEGDGHDVSFYAPVAGGALRALLVDDQPGLVRFLRTLDMVDWQMSVARAQARALRNLVVRSEGLEPEPLPGLEGGYDLVAADTYDAARLLILDHWVPGPLGALAVVPARDLLWYTPVVGPESVTLAVTLWHEANAALEDVPYPLVSDLFWQAEGRLERVEISVEVGEARVRLPARLQALLDALH